MCQARFLRQVPPADEPAVAPRWRRLAALALALLVLPPAGCVTSRHRPVSPAEPTWIAVCISPALARTILRQEGHPFTPHRLPHVPQAVGEVVEKTVATTVAVALVVGVVFLIARGGAPAGAFSSLAGSATEGGLSAGDGIPTGSVLDDGLTAILVSHDAVSGDLLDRQRLGQGRLRALAVPLYPGQLGRLALEIDDGERQACIPLAVIPASPGQRVEITIQAALQPVAATQPANAAPAP